MSTVTEYRYADIDAVRSANRVRGFHFFDAGTLRFFSSRIGADLYGGRYFITSERAPGAARRYTVRRANGDGSVSTVGAFQQYGTRRAAIAAAVLAAGKEC